jgi:hypothetical protein
LLSRALATQSIANIVIRVLINKKCHISDALVIY